MNSVPPHRNPPDSAAAAEGRASGPTSASVVGGRRARFDAALEVERRRMPLWSPVLAGLGVWLFFALPAEPSRWFLVLALGLPFTVVAAGIARAFERVPLALLA
ncbi:MAG: hypothetical protein AAF192_20990, partial [Pseudomonadota bacterium]